MAPAVRLCAFAILALTVFTFLAPTTDGAQGPNGMIFCRVPLTKSYAIRPEFCPPQIVAFIAQTIPCEGECCGPYGVPRIHTAGQNVIVRASTETHAHIAKYLRDMGVTLPPTVGTPD